MPRRPMGEHVRMASPPLHPPLVNARIADAPQGEALQVPAEVVRQQ